jgi:5-methylcytosine-specific restriction protein A
MEYEINKIYNRRLDIHSNYGGQQQGGICTPASAPYIFLFTGESGEQYGYSDGPDEDGVFLYTGEGQLGDMDFIRGNKAIRDHEINGKDLLLFQALGKNRGYRFLGKYACANYEFRNAPDRDGSMRRVIVFHLVNADLDDTGSNEVEQPKISNSLDIGQLKTRAYEASNANQGVAGKYAKTIYRMRSQAVKDYVLARADGVCECCRLPAPFKRKDGSAYLEPHHIRRLSDGGPDHPRWVAAICPNCHRQIHFGADGELLNKQLEIYLKDIE